MTKPATNISEMHVRHRLVLSPNNSHLFKTPKNTTRKGNIITEVIQPESITHEFTIFISTQYITILPTPDAVPSASSPQSPENAKRQFSPFQVQNRNQTGTDGTMIRVAVTGSKKCPLLQFSSRQLSVARHIHISFI